MVKKRRCHHEAQIEAALAYAETRGWRVEPSGAHAHAWGKMYCPNVDPDCRCGEFCITSIWGTPRRPEDHAKRIRRVVDGCSALKLRGSSDGEEG